MLEDTTQSLGLHAVRAAEACYLPVRAAMAADSLQLQAMADYGEALLPSQIWAGHVLDAEQLPAGSWDVLVVAQGSFELA